MGTSKNVQGRCFHSVVTDGEKRHRPSSRCSERHAQLRGTPRLSLPRLLCAGQDYIYLYGGFSDVPDPSGLMPQPHTEVRELLTWEPDRTGVPNTLLCLQRRPDQALTPPRGYAAATLFVDGGGHGEESNASQIFVFGGSKGAGDVRDDLWLYINSTQDTSIVVPGQNPECAQVLPWRQIYAGRVAGGAYFPNITMQGVVSIHGYRPSQFRVITVGGLQSQNGSADGFVNTVCRGHSASWPRIVTWCMHSLTHRCAHGPSSWRTTRCAWTCKCTSRTRCE